MAIMLWRADYSPLTVIQNRWAEERRISQIEVEDDELIAYLERDQNHVGGHIEG
jgi:hypothetical protein